MQISQRQTDKGVVEDVEFDGRTYTRYPYVGNLSHGRDFTSGMDRIDGHKRFLHRDVWEKFNGKIPEGCVVHHRDFNHSNNDIGNLILCRAAQHMSLHAKKFHREHPEFAMAQMEINQDKCREWHGSEEGRIQHSKQCDVFRDRRKVTIKCDQCGKDCEYDDLCSRSDRNHFCSNACKSKWRRYSGMDDVEVVCKICGSKFMGNKYAKRKICHDAGKHSRINKVDVRDLPGSDAGVQSDGGKLA